MGWKEREGEAFCFWASWDGKGENWGCGGEGKT